MQGYAGYKCDTCVSGKWGDQCLQNCSQSCKDSVCHKDYGACLHGCIKKFAGLNCTKCVLGLYGDDRVSGKYCNNPCPVNCMKTSANQTCNISNYCIHGCEDRFYSTKCNNCSDNCLQDKCEQETGRCLLGCKQEVTCENGKHKMTIKT